MALISCPECGKEVSDKVKACPFCGYPFQDFEENKKFNENNYSSKTTSNNNYCRNCGGELNKGQKMCTKCGFDPLDSSNYCQNCGSETKEGQVVCTNCGFQLESNNKSLDMPDLLVMVLSFLLPIFGGIGYILWNKNDPLKASLSAKSALAGLVIWILLFWW